MEHFFQNIPGWFNCEPLYRRMVAEAKDNARFVEVGAWKGRSAAFLAVEIANSGKIISFHVVDHFMGSQEHQEDQDVVQNTLKETFLHNIRPVEEYISVIDKPSEEASLLFGKESLDFVYIDASHDYENVKADILYWLPKVKPGGMIAGDDYACYPGVKQAVDELLPDAQIDGNIWMMRR